MECLFTYRGAGWICSGSDLLHSGSIAFKDSGSYLTDHESGGADGPLACGAKEYPYEHNSGLTLWTVMLPYLRGSRLGLASIVSFTWPP